MSQGRRPPRHRQDRARSSRRPPWLCACVCRGGLELGVGWGLGTAKTFQILKIRSKLTKPNQSYECADSSTNGSAHRFTASYYCASHAAAPTKAPTAPADTPTAAPIDAQQHWHWHRRWLPPLYPHHMPPGIITSVTSPSRYRSSVLCWRRAVSRDVIVSCCCLPPGLRTIARFLFSKPCGAHTCLCTNGSAHRFTASYYCASHAAAPTNEGSYGSSKPRIQCCRTDGSAY
jgi:hypothetical protein